MPQWIDAVGKLGPIAVAMAVFASTRAQNRWVNQVSLRTAAMEDQKLRLALLERRAQAIDALKSAEADFLAARGSSSNDIDSAIDGLHNALKTAELVFELDDEKAISDLIASLLMWRLDRQHRWRVEAKGAEAVHSAIAKIEMREWQIGELISELKPRLISSSRVQTIPPLAYLSTSKRLIHYLDAKISRMRQERQQPRRRWSRPPMGHRLRLRVQRIWKARPFQKEPPRDHS